MFTAAVTIFLTALLVFCFSVLYRKRNEATYTEFLFYIIGMQLLVVVIILLLLIVVAD